MPVAINGILVFDPITDPSFLSFAMANNLDAVIPQLLAQGLMALREQVRMPWLVNRAYESLAGEKGSTVEVPYPARIAVNDVAPSNTPPVTADTTPEKISIPLDQWKEAPFYLTDKDKLEVMRGAIPMIASEAIKALANTVDAYILGMYKKFGGATGTAGTTPFTAGGGNTSPATQVRKVLNKQLAPNDPRHVVMDPDAEAAALELRAFQDASWSGSTMGLMEGELNRKFGFRWWMSQNVLTHTASSGFTSASVEGNFTKGVKVIELDGVGSLLAGDVLTIAGVTDPIVVAEDVTLSTGVGVEVTLTMPLVTPLADGSNVTLMGDHVANMAFHRDAIAFVTRPLDSTDEGLGGRVQSAVDPESGLTLRLEVTREHKRTRYSYDILYGAQVIRPEFGARLVG